jgi:hypothetical protein
MENIMKSNSRNDQVQDWSELLKTAQENGAELDGAEPLIAALDVSQTQAVSLRSRRDALVASAREATRQVNEAFATGRDAAIVLRSYIRAVLGPRSEKLLRYRIKPIRKRRRSSHVSCGLPS